MFRRGQAVTAQDITDIFQDLIVRLNSVSNLLFTAGQVFDYGTIDLEGIESNLESEPMMSSIEQHFRSTLRPEYQSSVFGGGADRTVDADRYLEHFVDELNKIKERKRNG